MECEDCVFENGEDCFLFGHQIICCIDHIKVGSDSSFSFWSDEPCPECGAPTVFIDKLGARCFTQTCKWSGK